MKHELCENLFQARRAAGMTQTELSTAAQVSRSLIANIETGLRGTMKPANLDRVAQALNTTAEALRGSDPARQPRRRKAKAA